MLSRGALLLALLGSLAAAGEGPPLTAASEPLYPAWVPVLVPTSLLAPGTGQLLRGDPATGRTMLAAGGGFLGAAVLGAGMLISTGASDVSTPLSVPLLMVGIGGYASLGVADALGTFASDGEPFGDAIRREAWNARWRLGLEATAAMRPGVSDRPALRAFASHRLDGWLIHAEAGNAPGAADGFFGVGTGYRLRGYTEEMPHAGLWLEVSLRHEEVAPLGFDASRFRAQLVSTMPMGFFASRFGRMTSQLRLGVDPTWVRYRTNGQTDLEVPLSGGFELRLAAGERARFFGGYEHARDGVVSGFGTGFLGAFYAGGEVSLPGNTVFEARLLTGPAFAAALEWRL